MGQRRVAQAARSIRNGYHQRRLRSSIGACSPLTASLARPSAPRRSQISGRVLLGSRKIMGHCVYSVEAQRDGAVIVVAGNDMRRTLALLLMLPPLAVLPMAFIVVLVGNWSASIRLIASEAIFLAVLAIPVALVVQCTYGLICFFVLRKLHILNFWFCLLAGSLPFAVMKLTGYIEELSVVLAVGAFGLAVALSSWVVLRARNELS